MNSFREPRDTLRWQVVLLAVSCTMVAGCRRLLESLGGVRAYTWQSTSMEKTIYKGDTFLCNVEAYKTVGPARGDVVVFQHKGIVLAKRLIGLPGDRVEGKAGVVYRNGVALDEPYVWHTGPSSENLDTFGPKLVQAGTVFLLGDNRNNSLDSRLDEFGEVKLTDIQCKATSIVRSEHGTSGQSIR